MHELEASSGASQVQAAELAGLRDRVTTLTTQLKAGRPLLLDTWSFLKPCVCLEHGLTLLHSPNTSA